MIDLLHYTQFLQIKEQLIHDPIRKKWLQITPEELVRQSMVLYLLQTKKISKSKILTEYTYTWNQRKHRCDIVLLDEKMQPLIIIEIKAAHIPLSEKTYQQISRYQNVSSARGIILSNGTETLELLHQNQEWQIVDDIISILLEK